MSEAADAATIVAALNAARVPAFTIDTVPDPEPLTYTTVRVNRRYLPPQMMSGRPSVTASRLTLTFIAKVAANADLMRDRATAVLDGLFVGDLGPFNFETGDPIGIDEGFFVAQATYTF